MPGKRWKIWGFKNHGMFDACDLEGEDGFTYRLHKDRIEIHYEESKRNFISEVAGEEEIEEMFLKASQEISLFWEDICGKYSKKEAFFELSMLCRMLLSAVIYGDRKDTIEFTYGISLKETKISWENEIDYFESKIKCFSSGCLPYEYKAAVVLYMNLIMRLER